MTQYRPESDPIGTIDPVVEDVLVQVDNFFYPIDFVFFDIEPSTMGTNHVPIILGRSFITSSNALINCRKDLM